ncbi:PREDICTED: LOW QUALITY PROTEIN: chromosome unknown open reading frame, human C22orf29 [Elephantulus edwardii]|uniref:LOW QUALITY PROTEIN: chromosome unknown open reading frame, human C22orf29 n=1 Tax=Elephantulus edwardii TaxID=28737 RepID=UPI0003F0C9C2|nr:PREDICTED: LOW QUALITY PROTEIN: chromosome unknown open reading frame, human C22orf29 [Elephantulus edwardii]
MSRGQNHQRGPLNPIWTAARYANWQSWHLVDRASPGICHSPVDPWLACICCGDSRCTCSALKKKSLGAPALPDSNELILRDLKGGTPGPP